MRTRKQKIVLSAKILSALFVFVFVIMIIFRDALLQKAISVITNKLDLTSEEAQKFWPVHNNYQKELMELMKKRREDRQKTDIAPNDKINAELAFESKILDLKKRYKKLYSKVIPSQKILLLYQAEREFREHLIKQLNHRRKSAN